MSTALLIARIALASVFALAAVGKLADRAGFHRTLHEFGVPARLAAPGAVLLAVAELTIAALLVPSATAPTAAIAAAVMLGLFCVAVARTLAGGERPDCNCFGRAHSTAVGPATLARNVVLAGAAASVALAGPGRSLGAALEGVDPTVVVLSVALMLQAWFSWQLFRQHGRLIDRIRALEAPHGEPQSKPTPAVAELRVVRG